MIVKVTRAGSEGQLTEDVDTRHVTGVDDLGRITLADGRLLSVTEDSKDKLLYACHLERLHMTLLLCLEQPGPRSGTAAVEQLGRGAQLFGLPIPQFMKPPQDRRIIRATEGVLDA